MTTTPSASASITSHRHTFDFMLHWELLRPIISAATSNINNTVYSYGPQAVHYILWSYLLTERICSFNNLHPYLPGLLSPSFSSLVATNLCFYEGLVCSFCFFIPHVSEIIPYFLYVIISLSIMLSKFIYIVTNGVDFLFHG